MADLNLKNVFPPSMVLFNGWLDKSASKIIFHNYVSFIIKRKKMLSHCLPVNRFFSIDAQYNWNILDSRVFLVEFYFILANLLNNLSGVSFRTFSLLYPINLAKTLVWFTIICHYFSGTSIFYFNQNTFPPSNWKLSEPQFETLCDL
jgi:hypothetical protein